MSLFQEGINISMLDIYSFLDIKQKYIKRYSRKTTYIFYKLYFYKRKWRSKEGVKEIFWRKNKW